MNETNNDQNQKPKTSKLAIASIICFSIFFALILLAMSFLHDIHMPVWLEWLLGLTICGFFIAAPILGISALIHIVISKKRLYGEGLAATSIVIPIAIFLFLIGLTHQQIADQRNACAYSLSEIGAAIKLYANDNEDQLPICDSWCDLLIIEAHASDSDFIHDREADVLWGESSYALNKNITGLKLSQIPIDVVLIFETDFGRNTGSEKLSSRVYYWEVNDPNDKYSVSRIEGMEVDKDRWNQVGGKEILTNEHHGDKGCHFLFADGTVKFVKTKDLDTLRWEP